MELSLIAIGLATVYANQHRHGMTFSVSIFFYLSALLLGSFWLVACGTACLVFGSIEAMVKLKPSIRILVLSLLVAAVLTPLSVTQWLERTSDASDTNHQSTAPTFKTAPVSSSELKFMVRLDGIPELSSLGLNVRRQNSQRFAPASISTPEIRAQGVIHLVSDSSGRTSPPSGAISPMIKVHWTGMIQATDVCQGCCPQPKVRLNDSVPQGQLIEAMKPSSTQPTAPVQLIANVN
ncbi:MAG: hypothetical protein HKN47_22725 [Pirellulaceae bacterium]|nr:hypothetical protein [Pirellulaceae bacterium]